MSRRRTTYRQGYRRGRKVQRRRNRRSSGRPSMFWGRALLTAVILMCIWAWSRGQA
jgi:hypothetical protein